jgi:hypothetical protein
MQLRSGHAPLNFFLNKIGKLDTDRCKVCRTEPGDEPPQETVKHFLFECNAYDGQRRTLTGIIGAENLNLKNIMREVKYMKALANYVIKTGRLNITT